MKNIPTVEELRKQGYKVTVKHRRLFFKYDPFTGKRHEVLLSFAQKTALQIRVNPITNEFYDANPFKDYYLSATGGDTFVTIESEKYPQGISRLAICSKQDTFCKASGRKKAIAKAFAPIYEEMRNCGN